MCLIPGLPTPGSEVSVLITRVNLNTSCDFVELWVNMDDGRKHTYEQMKEDIQTPNRKFNGLEGKPGDLCLVCISDTWHRARIVSIQSETCNVYLIDQGQPHITTTEALAWGQSDSFLLPPEIESCVLANVLSLDNDWPERATKFLSSLPGKKFKGLVQDVLMPDRIILLDIPIVSKHICKGGVAKKIPVDEFKCLLLKRLHLPEGEDSEADCIKQEQNLNASCQLENHDQYFYPELLIDAFENVIVTQVTNPQNIFCKLLIFSAAVEILSEQIQQYYEECSDLGETQPQTCGDPCAARGLNGRWHRSLLKQNMTNDSAVEVLHVDEGKTELIPVGDIKPLHAKFLRMPVVTYPCSLDFVDDKTEWTTDQTDYLKSLILHQKVMATFDHHDMSKDVYYVTLYSDNVGNVNAHFAEKLGVLPPSETQQDSDVQNEPILSSFLSSLGDERCKNVHNKVSENGDGLMEKPLPNTKRLAVSGGSQCGTDDIQIKDGSEHPDPVVQSNGHLPTGFPSKVQNAHDNIVFTAGSSVNVNISCIESLQKFWCQTTESADSLRLLMQDLQNHYAPAHPQPLVGSICVARNPTNKMWYRAKISESHHSPLVDVRFIDFGHTQKVPLQDLRPIDPAFLWVNAQAFQCCLLSLKNPTNPTATPWSDSALKEFQKFVSASPNVGLKCTVKAVTSDEEGLLLNVVDIETPSDSACELLAQRCAQDEAQVQIPPQVPSETFSYSTHNIEVGGKETVWVTSSANVNHFYCQLSRNSHLFEKVMENVKQLTGLPQCTDHPLELDSICFARYTDNQWYRGQIVAVSPKFKVHFVDYGDTLVVNESDICHIPTEASITRSVPVLAVPLGLFDVPEEVPTETNQWFADCAVGYSLTISVVAKGPNGKLIVELFDGSLNVNVKIRQMISQMTQHKMTSLLQQTHQQPSNSSRDCSRDAPEINHGKTLDEGRKPTLDVITEEKETVLAETFIQGSHSDLEVTQHSHHSCSEESVKICMYKRPNISLNKTEEVYASCIEGPHYFWCQYTSTEDLDIVSMLAQDAGQAQQDKMFPKTLHPGSPCLALFSSDNQWYRAQVVHRTDSTLHVVFIDHGNKSDVDIKNVKPLPQCLLEKAPQAFLCSLNGFDESKGTWIDEVKEDFNSRLVDKPLKVTVFKVQTHSEIALPRYAVEIECEGVVVNAAMQKYWRPVAKARVLIESPRTKTCLKDGQTESNMRHLNVSKGSVNTCKYNNPNISKNKKEEVYPSCIVGPHFFWCQYTNTEDLTDLSRLAQDAGQAQLDTMFLKTLGPGSPCLALFSCDNQWYRAQVIQRIDNTLHVVFIDYGNESDVDIKDVRPLPQSLLEKAPQAFLCSLNGFDESKGTWNDNVHDDFYNLVVDKPLKLTIINMDTYSEIAVAQYAVEIECEGVAVNTLIEKYWKPVAKECVLVAAPQTEALLQDRQTVSNTTHLSVSKGNVNTYMYNGPNISKNKSEMVYASCIVGPHYFWCQHTNTEDLDMVTVLAQEVGQAQLLDRACTKSLDPGSPCLALFSSDNQWYRAQVVHRTDSTLHVVFVDYGNESDVDIKDVRPLPQSLLEKAPQAFLCSLHGFDESKGSFDGKVYDDFYSLVVDKPLKLTALSVEENSEIEVPQYAVEIECEGLVVNAAIQKYWKPVAKECVLVKSPHTETFLHDGQAESNMTHLRVDKGNVNTCKYKWPKTSLNETEMAYASCIAGPSFFWCQYTNTDELTNISSLAQEAGKVHQDVTFLETLGPGSPCLALFSSDEQWYRAQVMRKDGDAFHVAFIDYGDESDVDMKNVRPLPQSLLDKAPQAFLCSLNGFDESKGSWDGDAYDDFYNLVVDKPFRLTVFNVDDHSEIAVPQYAVEIDCEGVAVNTLMGKYWKRLNTDQALGDGVGSVDQDDEECRRLK